MATKKSFEKNIEELENIVNSLETGEVPLDDCIALYEKGVKLSDECLKILNNAKQKITLLSENGESEFDFDEDNSNE